MRTLRERLGLVARDDSGLTLAEVLVAISIIAIVATSAGMLTISGIAAATTQERKQIAVTIASGAMETANAHSSAKNTTTGVTDLLTGRTPAAVASAWTGATGQPSVAQTYQAWDPTAIVTGTPGIPIKSNVVQAGTTFTVVTLIGTCYQPLAGGDCTVLPGYLLAPVVTPAGYTQMIRVIVVVSWTAGSACSTSGACVYSTSSLIDVNSDLEWVTHA